MPAAKLLDMSIVSWKETCHYVFDDNFTVNCPITVIFGTYIAQSIGH